MDATASSRTARAVTYCIVPPDLAVDVHDVLRRHFRDDPSVQIVVERRNADRRRNPQRRHAVDVQAPAERRAIRSDEGRRIADRRGPAMAIDTPSDVAALVGAETAARLRFFSCLGPGSARSEEADSKRLVTRFQAGDTEVFGQLYMRYFERVYTYLRAILGDAAQAEAAAQRAFEIALERLPSYRIVARKPFRRWLFAIVRDVAVAQLCASNGLEPSKYSAASAAKAHLYEAPDFHALDQASDRELVFCVEDLPIAERQVLMLEYMLGLGPRDIATILDCPRDDVRMLRHHAMSLLRERLPKVTGARVRGVYTR